MAPSRAAAIWHQVSLSLNAFRPGVLMRTLSFTNILEYIATISPLFFKYIQELGQVGGNGNSGAPP